MSAKVCSTNYEVEYYSHVMHIASQVEGRIRADLDAIDALVAGFPAGTVSGAPKIRAMEIINELEPGSRGIYGGGGTPGNGRLNEMGYITMSSEGNFIDFVSDDWAKYRFLFPREV